MTGFFLFIHVVVCIFLVIIILLQSGRGGGLTEAFSSAGDMFGAKTNEMLIRATTVIASIFFATCLTLAILSAQKGKSLMTTQALSQMPTAQQAVADAPETPALPAFE